MKLATLSTEQKQLLESFSDAGGVVDFIHFECDQDTSNYETHRKAVILGFKELQRRVRVIVYISLKERCGMYVRYIISLISLLLFCTCLSSCHRGISTNTSRPIEELPQFSDESDISSDLPAYFFNKPMIAVFQTRFASYNDLFQPEITFAVWDNGTFLLKENRNYVTGTLSVQSLSDVNNIMNNKKYYSCLTKSLYAYPHSDLYCSILSTGNKDYSTYSSFRLTGADDLDDVSGFQIWESDNSSFEYIRKTNDTIKEHLEKSTASGGFSLSEGNVMQIVSKWGHGPPYLTNEEIKEIIQGDYRPPYITNDNSSKTD